MWVGIINLQRKAIAWIKGEKSILEIILQEMKILISIERREKL